MEAKRSISERAAALYRIRKTFGWDAATVAGKLDVTARTVGLWETGVQDIPDARWQLFMFLVASEIRRIPEMVVVVADDGTTPVDAVSDANYAGFADDPSGPYALIASYAVDRLTGQPRMHRQRFLKAENQHVINAAQRWDDDRRLQAHDPDKALLEMNRWLTRRILEAELRNPKITELKAAIADAKVALDQAGADAPESERRRLIGEMDAAIAALMTEVERKKRGT